MKRGFIEPSCARTLQFARGDAVLRPDLSAVCGVLSIAAVALAGQAPVLRTFDADRAGPPAGFQLSIMRQTAPGLWAIRREGPSGWLDHQGRPENRGYAMAIADGVADRDLMVSARVRFGEGARIGGLVWRYADEGHFWAVLLDLSAREIAMYRVTGGHRVEIEETEDLELDPAAWHTIKVVHVDGRTYVTLGGVRVFDDRDDRRSRTDPLGRVGLIAAGNATVSFDDFRLEPARGRR
jgi:hypothetical protein